MGYKEFVNKYDFSRKEMGQIEKHSRENSGHIIFTREGDYQKIKLLFDHGKDKQISFKKTSSGKIKFFIDDNEIKEFDSFNKMINYLEEET